MTPAIILFAHGSRDPLWRGPVEAVATRIRARLAASAQDGLVGCAYLELMQPDLPSLAADFIAGGATQLRLLPMFLGVGRHAREDLPLLVAQLRQAHTGIAIELRQPVGEDPRLLDLLAEMALGDVGLGNVAPGDVAVGD